MQAKFYKQISALGMLHMYWQRCISDGQCGFNEFIESYYMVQCVLPIVYPILFTGSMNSLNPYHMTQCVRLVAHIIWYTVTSLCVGVRASGSSILGRRSLLTCLVSRACGTHMF